MANKVIAIDPDQRSSVTGKEITGWQVEDVDYPELNQVLYQSITDHVWGTSAQVTAGSASIYTTGAGAPLDASAASVTINEDDKILIKHDVTQTANLVLDAGGVKFTLEMYGGVTLNMNTFDLTIGGTGDETSGSIDVISTGTTSIEKSNGFRVSQTGGSVSSAAGDIIVNNAVIADNFAIDWEATNLVMSLPTVATVDINATKIQLVSTDNVIKIIEGLDHTLTMPTDLNAGSEKPSTDYETYTSANVAGTIGGKLVPILTGTTTATNSGFLVDGGQTFLDDLVLQNSIVVNNTDGISTTCSIDAAANNTFAVTDDIFTIGEEYTIYLIPTFDSGHIFFAKTGRAFNDAGSDFTNFAYEKPVELYAYFKDKKANNTSGGTFTSGAYRIRDINDLDTNIAGVSLGTNQVTLTAGSYAVDVSCPAFNVNSHQAVLYNVTDAAIEVVGSMEYMGNTASANNRCFIIGMFTITSAKVFEIHHQCQTTATTDGFGQSGTPLTVSEITVFTQGKFTKIG